MTTRLQGTGKPLDVSPEAPVHIIGERINPSGKKELRRALLDQRWDHIVAEARQQVEAGADVIDVNVGGKGIDEIVLLPEAVKFISQAVTVPLSIDTRVPDALKAALAVCPGRPLVNSIGGETKVLKENLPIVSEHKVPVIVLCMGQDGIPSSADARLRVAHQVLETAIQAGVRQEDVIFDPLVMTVGADDQAARVALDTVYRLREEFPENNITGGASNISFGMPDRSILNANFLAAAVTRGMNIPIVDPTDLNVRTSLRLADVFLGRDKSTRRYLRDYRSWMREPERV